MGAQLVVAAVVAGLFIIIVINRISARSRHKRLPPGSMGFFPIVGETLEYARPSPGFLPGAFLTHRIQRYGKLFKSHLFGVAVIVSADANVNQLILQKEGTLFKSSYPRSFRDLLGPYSTPGIHGETHKVVRNAILNVVGARLRSEQVMNYISSETLRQMKSWEGKVVHLLHKCPRLSFSLVINQLLSLNPIEHAAKVEYLLHNFEVLFNGLTRVPINLPGTSYRRSLLARSKVVKFIEKEIFERRSKPKREVSDALDGLLALEGSVLTLDIISDVMVGLIFAGYETTSSIFAFATKFIIDNPQVMKTLQEEHSCILDQIAGETKNALTWDIYKSMSFTEKVVKETLRIVSVGDIVFREAIQDVEINGYTIPKGWKVMPCFIPPHMDNDHFIDPLLFNPWRWNQENLGSVAFIPFGGGIRQCLGKELAKLEVSIFIHHLITKFKWKQMEEDEAIRTPNAMFKKGLPIYFEECNINSTRGI